MAHTSDTTTPTAARSRHRIAQLLGGTAVVAALALSTGVAHADDSGTGTTKQARLEEVCAKVPTLETKVDTAIARLQGDASVKGSLAWLQAKLDKATAAGHTQAASVIANRLQVRNQTLVLLQAKQVSLTQIAQICADHGLGS